MDALRAGAADAVAAGRQQTVLLLTDGQPTVEPPAVHGAAVSDNRHVSAMRRYWAAHPGFNCTVRTFGFGYSLDSELLLQVRRFPPHVLSDRVASRRRRVCVSVRRYTLAR